MRQQRKRDKATSSEADYGWNHDPLKTVRPLFWQRYNSSGAILPEQGAWLDQDKALLDDLQTFGWVVHFAQNILDEEDRLEEEAKRRAKEHRR